MLWSGQDGIKIERDIELEPCVELGLQKISLAGEAKTNREKASNISKPSYLCPKQGTEMHVRGNFYSDEFDYVRVKLRGCVESETLQCATPDEVLLRPNLRLLFPRSFINY